MKIKDKRLCEFDLQDIYNSPRFSCDIDYRFSFTRRINYYDFKLSRSKTKNVVDKAQFGWK